MTDLDKRPQRSPLNRDFFIGDATDVAPGLLNKVLVAGGCEGRIVEVEAYTGDDPASHSFRGRTERNAAMFGPAGHLYVYFTYGMHHCVNVSTGAEGDGQAVLLRAVVPMSGLELMTARRGRGRRIADGPGKLCQAFAIDRSVNGVDLCDPSHGQPAIGIFDDGLEPPTEPQQSLRIGIRVGTDRLWRWSVAL